MTDPQGLAIAPVKERGEPLKLAALATHGFLDEDSAILYDLIDDKLAQFVIKAVVRKRADRKTVSIRRTALTTHLFPNIPGPDGGFEEADDPEAAEWAWTQLNELIWRRCDSNEGKPVQRRINANGTGLLLCRTWATGEKGVQGVYVTSDWECIREDFIKPDQKKVENAIEQQAKNAEMGIERLPEFGQKFRTQLTTSTKRVLSSGTARLDLLIEAGDDPEAEDVE